MDRKMQLNKQIYDFIEYKFDYYNMRYGALHGEYVLFNETSKKFEIPILDIYWIHCEEQLCKYPSLKRIDKDSYIQMIFKVMMKSGFFSRDENNSWYYDGKQIDMGQIPKTL